MEMTTVYIWGTIGALFCFVIGAMIGYVWQERHHDDLAQAQARHHLLWQDETMQKHGAAIELERHVQRELEISVLLAGQSVEAIQTDLNKMEERWKYADNYRKAIVETLLLHNLWNFNLHSDNPTEMLLHLIKCITDEAVDPAVSKPAKNLITCGVRKAGKTWRARIAKLQAEHEVDTNSLRQVHHNSVVMRQTFTEAVTNVLNDKIALPGVRKSIKEAISIETTRLRQVAAKKGA